MAHREHGDAVRVAHAGVAERRAVERAALADGEPADALAGAAQQRQKLVLTAGAAGLDDDAAAGGAEQGATLARSTATVTRPSPPAVVGARFDTGGEVSSSSSADSAAWGSVGSGVAGSASALPPPSEFALTTGPRTDAPSTWTVTSSPRTRPVGTSAGTETARRPAGTRRDTPEVGGAAATVARARSSMATDTSARSNSVRSRSANRDSISASGTSAGNVQSPSRISRRRSSGSGG